MEEAGKSRLLKKRSVDNAAVTQEQMTASQRATQINGRDIHGNLAFNHHHQSSNITIHYHKGVSTTIKQSLGISSLGRSPSSPRTPQPEVPQPLAQRSEEDDAQSLSESHHSDTESLTRASHFVETGLNQADTLPRRESDLASSYLDLKEDTHSGNESTGQGSQKQRAFRERKVIRRRNMGIGLIAVVILVILGIVTGVVISGKKHKHPALSTTSSSSMLNHSNTSHPIDFGSSTSEPNSMLTNESMVFNSTSQLSQQANSHPKISTLKSPTSNTASTTSEQIPITASTSAVSSNSCTTCQASTSPSSTIAPTTSTASTTKQSPAPIAATPAPSTTRNPTTTPEFCKTDGDCTLIPGQACDYSSSTCFFCTFALQGASCTDNYGCCDPFHCLLSTISSGIKYSVCSSVSS